MPISRGSNDEGASLERLAEWQTRSYSAFRARAERNAGADDRIPLDPLVAMYTTRRALAELD